MIAVNIQGGLGNQLFQYAFAFTIANQYRTFAFLDHSHPFIIPIYFKINKYHLWIENYKFLRKINRKICNRIKSSNFVDLTDCNIPYKKELIKNNTYYNGFFQSEKFFDNNKDPINKKFKIRRRYRIQFTNKYKEYLDQNNVLVIHIRRKDYLTHGIGKGLGNDDLSLPVDFYKKSLSSINNIEKYKIFVIGDDTEFAKNNFSFLRNVSFPENDLIIDFQLIMNADIAIISNSTFAWWAAYQNNKPNKLIIAPKYFLGFYLGREFPNGISVNTTFKWVDVLS
ncbi:MAG TPA: alpha-1,2-fucosyltransferase [Prolixibacteraceae bacterium]|nr:alpha-1,2-fucosyltransferase [Prolixibacteraceae bacterium]HOS90509.1 alpha-1,2-fucosyltransferase [Prolixibacteraceae bacterium]HPL45564.1 alpha-1,2-fucosyltransferase [Prolixibacteraceae bacterium]HQE52622.1 alpha-1,2-fucosyltransferase [Prolixibacteraceae bacterium]HQJ85821.1 alpha-1,2-fucosyltransferase [Prolixibacteraceae bacterium]